MLNVKEENDSAVDFDEAQDVRRGNGQQPPPTKWTISRRSPSARSVACQRSRATMSRLSSTATRSDFIPSWSTSAARVSPSAANSRASPLMNKRMGLVYEDTER